MQNVMIEIASTEQLRGNSVIVPETTIPNMQRIYGNQIKSIYPVDSNGNKVQAALKTTIDPQKRANDALIIRAKELKIKGYQVMSFETLLKAVQAANLKSMQSNQSVSEEK